MSPSSRNAAILVVLVVAVGAGLLWTYTSNATPSGRLVVAGNVRPGIRTVTAPALTYPTPDYTVGIPQPAGAAMSPKKRASNSTPTRNGLPVVAGTLATVTVTEGDTVEAGQLLAAFDTTMLDLGVEQARTAQRKARRDVAVMANNIDDLDDASSKLTTARARIATAKASLLKAKAALPRARKQLLAQRAKLLEAKARRPQLEAALAALKAQAAQFPPGQVPAAITKQIADLTKLLAAIDPGLAAIAKGLKTIDANIAKVDSGLAQLPAASAQIVSAEAKLADAKTQLRNAKDVLGIVADGSAIGVDIAKARRTQALVHSPLDGVVTFARRAGTVAMVGAPLVRIADTAPQRIDTYLTAEQVATVGVGSDVDITYDSAQGEALHGTVSEIGSAYVFPPTSFPTQIVHMTRAVKVTVLLDEGETAPAGTPVDLSIHTNGAP